jgi:hypothetical protein
MSSTAELFNQRAEALRRFATATTPARRRALLRLALQEHLHLHRVLLITAAAPVPTVALATRGLLDEDQDLAACRALFACCRDLLLVVAERLDRGAIRGRTAVALRRALSDTVQVTDRALGRLAKM